MIPFDWVYGTKKKTMSKFEVGMRVTYSSPLSYNIHGVIFDIKGDDFPYPIIVIMDGIGPCVFTMEGSFREHGPVLLKIRDEI